MVIVYMDNRVNGMYSTEQKIRVRKKSLKNERFRQLKKVFSYKTNRLFTS